MKKKNLGDKICDAHFKIVGFSLTKEVLVAYIWLFLMSLIVSMITK